MSKQPPVSAPADYALPTQGGSYIVPPGATVPTPAPEPAPQTEEQPK